jgi:arginyl-tRNA synthetase
LRKVSFDPESKIDYSLLTDEVSKDVVRLLSKFNETVILAHKNYEPHTVARYAVELAQNFNHFYHDNAILVEDEALKNARLALVHSTKIVLENALKLVCLKAPEQM